jgi:hypothetical protein
MLTQPCLQRGGAAIGQDIDPAGQRVDEHRGVPTPLTQREVINPQHRGTSTAGTGRRRRTRSAVCREIGAAIAVDTRLPPRPANSLTTTAI